MAILSNVNGKFAVDSTGAIQFSGQTGTSGYVLKSNGNAAPTWVDGSTVIGGPYLPLSGGTLTGATATASGISFTVGGALSASSLTDGFISWGFAQLNRYGAAIELQYTPTNAATLVKIGANGSNPTIFNAYTGDATFKGNVTLNTNGTNFTHGYSGNGLVLSHHNVGPSNAIVSGNSVYPDNLYINNGGAASDWSNVIITGNVGIGTPSPTALLDFGTSIQDNKIHLYASGNDKYGMGIRGSQFLLYSGGLGSGSGGITFGKMNGTTYTENMRVTNDGNVGIGTTSPDRLLEISHDLTSHEPVLRLTGTSNLGYAAGIQWQSGFGPKTSAEIFSTASGSQGGELWINVRDQTTNALERRMYFKNNGYIGIGTSAPSAKLEIKATGSSTGLTFKTTDAAGNENFFIQDGGRTGVRYYPFTIGQTSGTSAASGARFQVATTAGDFVVLNDGKTGIGTTSPNANLQVNRNTNTANLLNLLDVCASIGNTNPAPGNHYPSGIRVYQGNGTIGSGFAVMNIGVNTNSATVANGNSGIIETPIGMTQGIQISARDTSGFIRFNTGNSEKMRITSGGQIQTPQNPAFRARAKTSQSYAAGWQKVLYDGSVTTRGTGYASSRFTAPVDGWYQFNAQWTANDNADIDGTFSLWINGSSTNLAGSVSQPSTGSAYDGHVVSGCCYLAATHYVEVYRYSSIVNETRTSNPYGGWFSGFLIG